MTGSGANRSAETASRAAASSSLKRPSAWMRRRARPAKTRSSPGESMPTRLASGARAVIHVKITRQPPALGEEPRAAAVRGPRLRVLPHALDGGRPAEEATRARIGINEALRSDDAVLLPVLKH